MAKRSREKKPPLSYREFRQQRVHSLVTYLTMEDPSRTVDARAKCLFLHDDAQAQLDLIRLIVANKDAVNELVTMVCRRPRMMKEITLEELEEVRAAVAAADVMRS